MNFSLGKPDKTTLAVVIPNYNHGHLLKELIPTLFKQSRPPDEVVLVDDGSSDDSVTIIEKLSSQNNKIKLFRNKKNQGVIYSLNRALKEVSSEYVTFPSADNSIMPGMYEESLSLLEKHPEAGLCCSDPYYFDTKTGEKYLRTLNLSPVACYFSPNNVEALCKKKSFCPGNFSHTMIVRLKAMKIVMKGEEYFYPELKWHADFFLWNVIALRHGICYIPKGFGVFRMDESSYSAKPSPQQEKKQVYIHMLNFLKKPEFSDIRSRFQKSALFTQFTHSMFALLLLHPKYYGYFRKTYVQKAIIAALFSWRRTIRNYLKSYLRSSLL